MKRIITIILLVLTLGFITFNYVRSEAETKEAMTQVETLSNEYEQAIITRDKVIAKIDEISLLIKDRSDRLVLIEEQLKNCSSEKEALRNELIAKAKEIQDLITERDKLASDLAEANFKVKDLEKQLNATISTINSQLTLIEKLQKDNEALTNRVLELEKENEALKKQIEDLLNGTNNPDDTTGVDYTNAAAVRDYIRNSSTNYTWLGYENTVNKGIQFNQLGNTDIFYLIHNGNMIIIRWGDSPRNDAGYLESIFNFRVFDGGYLSINGGTPTKMRIIKDNQIDSLNIDDILIRMSKTV